MSALSTQSAVRLLQVRAQEAISVVLLACLSRFAITKQQKPRFSSVKTSPHPWPFRTESKGVSSAATRHVRRDISAHAGTSELLSLTADNNLPLSIMSCSKISVDAVCYTWVHSCALFILIPAAFFLFPAPFFGLSSTLPLLCKPSLPLFRPSTLHLSSLIHFIYKSYSNKYLVYLAWETENFPMLLCRTISASLVEA